MSSGTPVSGQQRGRPRSERAHQAILAATRDLLIVTGYEQLTIEGIAARAGVGKQTVYRWWPSKSAVVVEAVLAGYVHLHGPAPADTGDVASDLRAWTREQVMLNSNAGTVALVRALTAAASESDADAARLYDRLTGPAREGLLRRLAVGMEEAQLRSGADLESAVDALLGALLYRVLVRQWRRPDAEADADGLVDVLMRGLGQGPA